MLEVIPATGSVCVPRAIGIRSSLEEDSLSISVSRWGVHGRSDRRFARQRLLCHSEARVDLHEVDRKWQGAVGQSLELAAAISSARSECSLAEGLALPGRA